MPNTISYSVKASCSNSQFKLNTGSNDNPIAIIDKDSNSLIKAIESPKPPYLKKEIFDIKKGSGKTNILSNSSSLLITNVFDSSGHPLYRKIPKGQFDYDAISVVGKESILEDDNFIYTNNSEEVIEYYRAEERIHSLRQASYPVFVPEFSAIYDMLKDLDDRSFSYTVTNNRLLNIHVNRSDAHIDIDNDTLFEIKNSSIDFISLHPAIHKESRKIGDKLNSIIYDFASTFSEIINVKREIPYIDLNHHAYISLPQIIFESINIDIIHSVDHNVVSTYSSLDIGIHSIDINQSRIDLTELDITEYLLDDNYYLAVSYKSLFDRNLDLNIEDFLYNNVHEALFYLSPNTVNGESSSSDKLFKLFLDAENKDRYIYSPAFDAEIPYQQSSEDEFYNTWEDSLNRYKELYKLSDSLPDDLAYNKSGIDSLNNLSFNNPEGWIYLGSIRKDNDLKEASIIVNDRLATPKYPLDVKRYNSHLLHFSIDEEITDFEIASGVKKINEVAGTHYPGRIIKGDQDMVTIAFNIEALSFAYDNSTLALKDILLKSDDDETVYNYIQDTLIVNPFSPIPNISDLTVFRVNENNEIVPAENLNTIKVSNNLKEAYISIAPDTYSKIGLGYLNQNTTILPEVFISL